MNFDVLDEVWLLIGHDHDCDLLEDIPDRIMITLAMDLLANLRPDHGMRGKTYDQCLGIIEFGHRGDLTEKQRYWLYQTLREHLDQRSLSWHRVNLRPCF